MNKKDVFKTIQGVSQLENTELREIGGGWTPSILGPSLLIPSLSMGLAFWVLSLFS